VAWSGLVGCNRCASRKRTVNMQGGGVSTLGNAPLTKLALVTIWQVLLLRLFMEYEVW